MLSTMSGMTVSDLADFIVLWTDRRWSQSVLDAVIRESGFTGYAIDRAFDKAASIIERDTNARVRALIGR